jgi:hypothetical protein
MSWFRITSAVSLVILSSLILYGSYEFYFDKPVPIINNNTFEKGATLNQKPEGKKQHLITGVSFNQNTVLASIGWLW